MSPAAMLLLAAAIWAAGKAADLIERRRARTPSELQATLGLGAGPDRDPPPPQLTPAEQAHLAHLARTYARGSTIAGKELADHLRRWCPGVPDTHIMRCVLALTSAARTFSREELTATDAMAALIAAAEVAAVDLAQFQRDEIPR